MSLPPGAPRRALAPLAVELVLEVAPNHSQQFRALPFRTCLSNNDCRCAISLFVLTIARHSVVMANA